MGMKYRNGSHTKYKIEYHFVWVTKYRYRVLIGDVGLRVSGVFQASCRLKFKFMPPCSLLPLIFPFQG